jgi:aspartokinase/homoserine dehydrogenase 1
MSAVVLKFGGTSVGTPTALRRAVARVAARAREGPLVVVVSAFAGTTDTIAAALAQAAAREARYRTVLGALRARTAAMLNAVAPDTTGRARRYAEAHCADMLRRLGELLDAVALLRRCPPDVHDEALATGERLAAPVLAAGVAAQRLAAELIDAGDLVRTDASFGAADVDLAATATRARAGLAGIALAVVPGFFGADRDGRTVLLGRGGSDTTATVLGGALAARRVEIWTDVDGVLTADPRRVPAARTLPALSYDHAAAAAALGARVLHARALAPAAAARVPIVVRNSFHDGAQTAIDAAGDVAAFVVTSTDSLESWRALGGDASRDPEMPPGFAALAAIGPHVEGRAAELVAALARRGVSIASLEARCGRGEFVSLVPAALLERGVEALHASLLAEWPAERVEARRALAV